MFINNNLGIYSQLPYFFTKYEESSYFITNSLRFRSPTTFLARASTATGNRTTWTWSAWVKKPSLSGASHCLFDVGPNSDTIGYTYIIITSTNAIGTATKESSELKYLGTSTAYFNDPSAYLHIVVAYDTTNSDATLRRRIYVNNTLAPRAASDTITRNSATLVNLSGYTHRMGVGITINGNLANYFDGYMADVNFIDGQALTPSSFGETDSVTGVWKAKRFTGAYGTNGFYLKFNNPNSLGADSSGRNNNWTPNNFSTTLGPTYDFMIDVPLGYNDGDYNRGNYATLNVFDIPTTANTGFTITNGSLQSQSTNTANRNHCRATMGVTSGKWYWEITNTINSARCMAGVALATSNKNQYVGYDINGWGLYQLDGNIFNGSTGSGSSYGLSWQVLNDVLMVALDATNNKLWFGKNGTWFNSGDPVAGTNAAFTNVTGGALFPAIGDGSGAGTYAAAINFGQQPFTNTTVWTTLKNAGFRTLNTYNISTP